MAEGGNFNEDNPYSFQHFAKNINKNSSNEDSLAEHKRNSKDDLLDEPDIGIPTRKELIASVLDEEKSNKREENPFSLKQFLKKDIGTKPKNKVKSNITEINGFSCPRFPIVNEAPSIEPSSKLPVPDFASGLPDFVQDHFYADHSLREIGNSNGEDKFPDFACNMERVASSPCEDSTVDSNNTSSASPTKLKNRGGSRIKRVLCENSIISSSLPDFLSDGPMLNNHIDHYQTQNEASPLQYQSGKHHDDGDSANEIIALQAENDQLKAQLHHTKQTLLNKCAKIQELQEEVTMLKAKEADETNALEKMVQQVETNLKTAVQRAVAAEGLVAKFSQEVKTLQAKVATMSAKNEEVRSDDSHLINVREKANSASQQIRLAATNAEQTIRQLTSGVESLKLIASYLSDIDRVTEAGHSSTGDDT